MKLGTVLVLINYAFFAAFLTFRPSEEAILHSKDVRWAAGHFEWNSAAPWTYIAARPLYNWTEWHGGELTWIKAVEVLNLPALFTGALAVRVARQSTQIGYYYESSWVRAWAFLAAATAQWLAIGSILTLWRRRAHAASAQPNSTVRPGT